MIAILDTYRSVVWAAVAALLTLGATVLYFALKPEPAPVGIHMPAAQASEVKGEPTAPLFLDMVKVFEPEVKTKLKLSKEVIEDANQYVVASSKVRADDRPHTITTTLNKNTGEFTTYDRAGPRPWLAINTKTHISAYYGLKNLEPVIRAQIQQELLQIKALHVEVVASGDFGAGKPDTFVGIGARASW